MYRKTLFAAAATVAAFASFGADPVDKIAPAWNTPTPMPLPTRVLPLLNVQIDKETGTVNFVNTNADPFVYTKAYKLKYADPYELRPYLMAAVRSRRIDTNEPKVEAIRYADGTGMLIVSAEEYRFKPSGNGMTIDQLVEALDRKGLSSEAGRKFFLYYPMYYDAESLRKLIVNVGIQRALDGAELTGGIDTVVSDVSLNALLFYCTPSSEKTIRKLLAEYDAPTTEAQITYTIYEIDSENDGNLGVDFQAWKNGMGTDLFAAGAAYLSGVPFLPGTNGINGISDNFTFVKDAHASYINFNPRWNTKFLDFLVARSKAKVVTSGTLAIMNRCTGTIKAVTRFPVIADATETTDASTKIVGSVADGAVSLEKQTTPETTVKNPKIRVTENLEFGFILELTPEVNGKASIVKVDMRNVNLVGFRSDGTPRNSVTKLATKIMLDNGGGTFYLGGLDKSEVVRGVNKVPYLGDIPGLGWIFSAESETVKKSRLAAVLTVQALAPDTVAAKSYLEEAKSIDKKIRDFGLKKKYLDENEYGFDQYLLDPDKGK
ncbi:MAG: hypothetical protein PHS41_07015 [Victivallaceae bacterium]|nr:hypothetical protein [Victivallaceae bacterium]